jgi:hypothetical protein
MSPRGNLSPRIDRFVPGGRRGESRIEGGKIKKPQKQENLAWGQVLERLGVKIGSLGGRLA